MEFDHNKVIDRLAIKYPKRLKMLNLFDEDDE